MTNPVDGIEDNKLNRNIKKDREFREFLRDYKKEEFCQHLSIIEKSRSPFEREGITCKFMSSATCRTEFLSPKDAIRNCHKCLSKCPNFKAVEIEKEPLSRQDIVGRVEEDVFDRNNEMHTSYAEKELQELTDSELHELYDICLDETKDCREHKKQCYQLSLFEKYPIENKQNMLLNVLRHTNEYATNEYANNVKYTTYKELLDRYADKDIRMSKELTCDETRQKIFKEIEDTFYKDFDIEDTCDLEEQLKPKCYDKSNCDKCSWHHKPQITDSALLQFICLLRKERIRISGSSIEELKSDVLQSLSAHKSLFYNEVRKILS